MSEHPWLEAAAGYALGALDPAERAAFEAHLAGCARCRDEVRTLRETASLLAHAAPEAAPAAALRDRVVDEARRVRPLRRRALVPWLAAAAALAALLAGTLRFAGVRAGLERDLAAARRLVTEKDSALTALLAPEVHVVSLAATGRDPTVRVFWNHDRNLFIVTAFDLPPAPAGRTYQLWALAKGTAAPVSMGTFNAGADGRAVVVLPVDATVLALGFLEACALTEEPAGGSPGPTETPRFVGTWRHTS